MILLVNHTNMASELWASGYVRISHFEYTNQKMNSDSCFQWVPWVSHMPEHLLKLVEGGKKL